MHVSISLYMRSGRISFTQEKKTFLVGEPQSRRGGGEIEREKVLKFQNFFLIKTLMLRVESRDLRRRCKRLQ